VVTRAFENTAQAFARRAIVVDDQQGGGRGLWSW
jgi:hypothetical protein